MDNKYNNETTSRIWLSLLCSSNNLFFSPTFYSFLDSCHSCILLPFYFFFTFLCHYLFFPLLLFLLPFSCFSFFTVFAFHFLPSSSLLHYIFSLSSLKFYTVCEEWDLNARYYDVGKFNVPRPLWERGCAIVS